MLVQSVYDEIKEYILNLELQPRSKFVEGNGIITLKTFKSMSAKV